jgi:hypothetical protein
MLQNGANKTITFERELVVSWCVSAYKSSPKTTRNSIPAQKVIWLNVNKSVLCQDATRLIEWCKVKLKPYVYVLYKIIYLKITN